MIYSRHELRAERIADNRALAKEAQDAASCGYCNAPLGSPCVSKAGVALASHYYAPGCHKDRLKQPRGEVRPVVAKPEYVTITDLADIYNVSRATIYRRIKDGTLTPYRIGGRTIRFDLSEVEAAFRGQPKETA